jgi:hypothetical protein
MTSDQSQSKGYDDRRFLILVIIFLILCYTSVAMRIYTRAYLVKIVGWDDGLMIVALVSIFWPKQVALAQIG